jgi:hypothetical protein
MLGQSFAPLGDPDALTRQQEPGAVNPVQEAIKVLTLRLPRVLGASPVPQELLRGLGSAGLPSRRPGGVDPDREQNPLTDFLQRLVGGMTPPTPNVKVITEPERSGTLAASIPDSPAAPPVLGDNSGPRRSDMPSPFGSNRRPPSY